jgi:hypothetical protein
MQIKKHIIHFLFSLLVFVSTSSLASGIANKQLIDKPTEINGTISQPSDADDYQGIAAIEGILQTSIKVDESNGSVFQNIKNGKKVFGFDTTFLSFYFSESCYSFYCSKRVNKINTSPFYIAYHRLLI